MRGDPKCSAGPNAVWDEAPAIFKEKIARKGNSKGKGGPKVKGKGKQQRNVGKRGPQTSGQAKTPCPNWSRGNGFCKYGPNCRNSHDGPKGGGAQSSKRKQEVIFLATKKGKKARKQLSSLLIKEMKESIGRDTEKLGQSNISEDEHLYQLIRGVPTVIIAREKNEDGPEYRPLQPQSISNWDLGEEDIDIEDLDLVSPQKFETWKIIRDQEKYREYLSEKIPEDKYVDNLHMDEARASSPRSHAWKNEIPVDFTVTLMATMGSSGESTSSESKSSSEEDDSTSSETESSGEDGSSNVGQKRDTSPGQSNFSGQLKTPCLNWFRLGEMDSANTD
jgi:hypothetical protein